MKKALVVLLALTCLSALAFADDVTWTFGTTIKTGAQITIPNEGSTMITLNDADSPSLSRVRFDAQAALGDFAAHVRVGGDYAGTVPATGSAATQFLNAWWVEAFFVDKMVQMQFGNLDHSVTDTVNKGWGGLSVDGAQFVVSPVTGASIGYAIPATPATFNNALANSRIGLSYTMPNMAIVKATYVNGAGEKNDNFNAGIEIDAVPNLLFQLEAQLVALGNKNTPSGTSGSIYGHNEIFVNATYALGPLTPGVELDINMYGDSSAKTSFSVKPKVDYVVMEGTAVGLSFNYTYKPLTTVDGGTFTQSDGSIVVDPYVKFTFNPKASLKIDAAYTIADTGDTGTWTLPINFNFIYSF